MASLVAEAWLRKKRQAEDERRHYRLAVHAFAEPHEHERLARSPTTIRHLVQGSRRGL
jgi:hypothetical protein